MSDLAQRWASVTRYCSTAQGGVDKALADDTRATLAAKDVEIAAITAERDALAKRVGEAGLLEWLAANPSLELKYEGWEDDVWEVYRVNGGRSDREWTLVATGDSPADALNTARAALKGADHD